MYYNAPTTSYASELSYDSAPQYATYVEAAPISYAPAPQVPYVAAPAPSYVYSVPESQPQPQLQLSQNNIAFDTIAPSTSNIDSYGAPLAPVIG